MRRPQLVASWSEDEGLYVSERKTWSRIYMMRVFFEFLNFPTLTSTLRRCYPACCVTVPVLCSPTFALYYVRFILFRVFKLFFSV